MSGGHFTFNGNLIGIAEQLEEDLRDSDFRKTLKESQYCQEIAYFTKKLILDLKIFNEIIHEYDYFFCGDRDEVDFLKLIRKFYLQGLSDDQKQSIIDGE